MERKNIAQKLLILTVLLLAAVNTKLIPAQAAPSASYSYSYVRQNPSGQFRVEDTMTLELYLLNTGTETWYRDRASGCSVHLGTGEPGGVGDYRAQDHISPFYQAGLYGWLEGNDPNGVSYSGRRVLMVENSVAPNGTATFRFTIKVPAIIGPVYEYWTPVVEGPGCSNPHWMNSIGIHFQAHVFPFRYSFVSRDPAYDYWHSQPRTFEIAVRNEGPCTWYKNANTTYPSTDCRHYAIHLGTGLYGITSDPNPYRIQDHASPFYTAGGTGWWTGTTGQNRIVMVENSVAPGQIARFQFAASVAASATPIWEYFTPVAENLDWMTHKTGTDLRINNNPYRATLHSQNPVGTISMETGATRTVWVKFTNTGRNAWNQSSARLGTVHPTTNAEDFASPFYHSSWLGAARPASLSESSVAPGNVGTFAFTIQAPPTAGTYKLRVRPLVEHAWWMEEQSMDVYWNVQVTTPAPTPPAAPSNLSAAAVSGSQINLSWADNSNNEDGFKIERSPNGSSSWIEVGAVNANVTAFQDTGLACNTTYYYRVYAHNAAGNSGYSNVALATTSACAPGNNALQGKRIVISPGHGFYHNGSGFVQQRGSYNGIIEDDMNMEFAILLRDYLRAAGAEVLVAREWDKNNGVVYPGTSIAMWRMGAARYLYYRGYPTSVYRSSGWQNANELWSDINARPKFANHESYFKKVDVFISLHTNGGGGTGTETFAIRSRTESWRLGQSVHQKVIAKIRELYPSWTDRGLKHGAYNELSYLSTNIPGALIEFAFHDNVNDANAIKNPAFRAKAAEGVYLGILDYFGVQANSIAVGQGSSRMQAFQAAYNATQSYISYGTPSGEAQWYTPSGGNRVVRQIFSNGPWLIHDEDADYGYRHTIPAYPIEGVIKDYWQTRGFLGAPTSNPFVNAAGQREQHFRNGYIISGGSLANTTHYPWPTSCSGSTPWRLEVRNVLKLPGATYINDPVATGNFANGSSQWPPFIQMPGGPTTVVCVNMSRPGYLLYYDVGSGPAVSNQGVWADQWTAKISGMVSGLPGGYWPVSAACDDGCRIRVNGSLRISSWRDQPPSNLGWFYVTNGDRIEIDWYESAGSAAVWLKMGTSALALPPLDVTCDARLWVADGASATAVPTVTLTISATDAVEMRLGNSEAATIAAPWQPYTTTLEWLLEPSSDVITRTVYAQFRDAGETILCNSAIIKDDVLLDPLPPQGQVEVMSHTSVTATLRLIATDQGPGNMVKDMLVIEGDDTALANMPDEWPWLENEWLPYTEELIVAAMPLYQVWFRDGAGNVSPRITLAGPTVPPAHQVFLPLVVRNTP